MGGKSGVDLLNKGLNRGLQVNLNLAAADARVFALFHFQLSMGPYQVSEVLSKHIPLVEDWTPGQRQTLFRWVASNQVFHIDHVETFFYRLRCITCRPFFEANPLEVEGASVQSDLVQHELSADQHDGSPYFSLYLLRNRCEGLALGRKLLHARRVAI